MSTDASHSTRPLQNRVAPDGSLHADAARGTLTGNRGIIHDPDTRTLLRRRWTTTSWIACTCDWKGQRRQVWGRNRPGGGVGWTELFFLDEVTALAAGHRPCFACRRQAADAFAAAFSLGNGMAAATAPRIDRVLHAERRLSSRNRPREVAAAQLCGLPDGTVVASGPAFFAFCAAAALPWDFGGYRPPVPLSRLPRPLTLVTPPAVAAALAAGYRPQWHESAGAPPA